MAISKWPFLESISCKMASETEYAYLPMKITCIEDIEEVLRNSDIFSQYRELLKQVNICILDFEELETNRTYLEMFSDWASGKREEVNSENLMMQLKLLKEALLTGLSMSTKLLVQKEKLQKYFRNFKIVNDGQIGEEKEIPRSPNVEAFVSPPKNEDNKYCNMKVVISSVVVSACICIAIYTICKQFESLRTPTPETTEIGKALYQTAGVGAFLCMTPIIYNLANFNEGDRSMKYQKIQELQDYINDTLLNEITRKNQNLDAIYEAIDKQLHSREVILYLASSFYSESKDKALEEIYADESDLNVDICEKLAIKTAKITCKSYLKHEFNCSNEETEEILNEIQRSGE